MAPGIATLRDVSLRFGRRWALARLSVSIPVGATTLLTGSNGAGKTTLLRVLATALRPTRGDLTLFGHPAYPHPEAVRARVGLLTHQSHLYEDLTPTENLTLLADLLGAPRGRIPVILSQVGLGDDAHRVVRQFSAGMKRRLCLGRLLLKEPELCLLDEPFGQLDPDGVVLMEESIRRLHERGATVVMSTHDIERGERIAQHHLHLRGGHMVGSLETL